MTTEQEREINEDGNQECSSSLATLFITANVGSIFEDCERLLPQWQREVLGHIAAVKPHFVAIHFQEVGGKNVQESVVEAVREFATGLTDGAALLGFVRHCAFFDQNYQDKERFTALGSLYLVHQSSTEVQIYNFQTKEYKPLLDSHFHVGDLSSSTPFAEQQKFPLHLFPEGKYSRKGFLHSKFILFAGGSEIDLVNIHLFHDACNLVSCSSTAPSVYYTYRRNALGHALDALDCDNAKLFLFGDLNFRLDGHSVLQKLSEGLAKASAADGGDRFVFYRDGGVSETPVLSVGKKEFILERQEETFGGAWNDWTELDVEGISKDSRLEEWPIAFPPTYPFEEDPSNGSKYMGTRCPAWCDRVLFSRHARKVMSPEVRVQYGVVGGEVCMGDHKPVFLSFGMKKKVTEDTEGATAAAAIDAEKCPRVESPTYTDLLSGGGGGANVSPSCTRYSAAAAADLDLSQVKMFKETTV